jgi:hypothetical protein
MQRVKNWILDIVDMLRMNNVNTRQKFNISVILIKKGTAQAYTQVIRKTKIQNEQSAFSKSLSCHQYGKKSSILQTISINNKRYLASFLTKGKNSLKGHPVPLINPIKY